MKAAAQGAEHKICQQIVLVGITHPALAKDERRSELAVKSSTAMPTPKSVQASQNLTIVERSVSASGFSATAWHSFSPGRGYANIKLHSSESIRSFAPVSESASIGGPDIASSLK